MAGVALAVTAWRRQTRIIDYLTAVEGDTRSIKKVADTAEEEFFDAHRKR